MNLRQLRYFCDVAKSENIAKVAEQYMVPASSVSIAIKHLETELGTPLFDRSANKIKLNQRGKLLAAELGTALEVIDSIAQQITETPSAPPKVKVLIRARPKWVTELIAQFKAENPQTNFIISNDYTITDIDKYDVIIDEDAPQYNSLERFLLSTEIICVKAASSSSLVEKDLTFSDLKGIPFVLPSIGNGMRNLYERICQQQGITPNVAIECNDRQCLQYYVQADMGLTLGAYRALKDNTQDNIAPLKVTDFNEIQSVYVYYQNKPHNNTAVKDFCHFLHRQRYL